MNRIRAGRRAVLRGATYLLVAVGALLPLAGCVVIPYQPDSETQHDVSEIRNPERIRLSVGPRRLLEEMAEELADEESRVELVDGQTFIDTAAPTGDLSLAGLFEPATRARIEPLQADYLVLVGEPEAETLSDWGGVATWAGFYGVGKERASSIYWAAVIDLRQMAVVEQLKTTATGTDAGLGLFYGIFVVSDTEGSAQRGVVRNLARALADAKPEGPLRVALLAREQRLTAEQRAVAERKRQLQERRSVGGLSALGVVSDSNSLVDDHPPFVEPAAPSAGEALVYLYRPMARTDLYLPLPVRADTGAGELEVTRLLAGGYFPYRVPAGTVRLWPDADRDEAISLTVAAGATHYVEVVTRTGWRKPRGKLAITESAAARAELIQCRLMPSMDDNVAELRKLSEEGYAFEQFELARLYSTGVPLADGRSLPLDPIESYKWYTAVIDARGVPTWMRDAARRDRDILAARMSDDAVAEGGRRGVEWLQTFERAFLAGPDADPDPDAVQSDADAARSSPGPG